MGFQERVRFDDTADGVIGFGFGLGDPRKNVGAQIGISLVDVSSPFTKFSKCLGIHSLVLDLDTRAGSRY